MSYTNQDIHNAAGPGSSAEPSMEEILASIRRILKEEEPGKPAEPAATAPEPAPASATALDIDDDVLVLDESMIAGPADFSSATSLPDEPGPAAEHPTTPMAAAGEPIHFSSEPVPFAGDYEPARASPEPAFDLPEIIDDDFPPQPGYHAASSKADAGETELPAEPEPEMSRATWAPWPSRLIEPAPTIAAEEPEPDHTPIVATPELDSRPEAEPWDDYDPAPLFEPETPEPAAEPTAQYEPDHHQEPEMNDSAENAYQPPENLISDQVTNAAASSIGALVRSMTTEKSVAVTKGSSITIEDIVRDEIRPLLKSWLDSHLPSLVERVVRTEIERVISRSVV